MNKLIGRGIILLLALISAFASTAVRAAPVLISPAGTIAASKPAYLWQPVPGSVFYKLEVRNANGILFSQKYTPSQVHCGNELDDCKIIPDVALAIGSYTWKLKSVNAAGQGVLASKSFRRGKPLQPITVSPVGDVATATPAYTWKAVSGAGNYNLQVSNSAGTVVVNQWYTATQLGCPSGTGNCVATPSSALKFVANQWKVMAKNALGNGPWSAVKAFKNAAMCNIQLVSDNTTGGCNIRLAEPANCEEIDLSNGKEYLFGWTTDGSYCETPWTFYIAGNPANLTTGDNIYWKQFSTDVSAGISHTGGLVRLSAAALDSLGLTSDNGIYHWLVVGWYGSHPASQTFRVKR